MAELELYRGPMTSPLTEEQLTVLYDAENLRSAVGLVKSSGKARVN